MCDLKKSPVKKDNTLSLSKKVDELFSSTFNKDGSLNFGMGQTFTSGYSMIDRDEKQCMEQWGLPFDQTERSLVGVEKSDISIDFMPKNDSLFKSLASHSESFSSTSSFPCKFTPRESLEFDEDCVPSITKIAEVLKNMPEDSGPLELMDNILFNSSLNVNSKKEKDSKNLKSMVGGDFTIVVTAGVAMSATFDVPENSTFELTESPGDSIDMIIKRILPNKLQIFVRAHFVGVKYYGLKSSTGSTETGIVALKIESRKNNLTVFPNRLEFEQSQKPVKKSLELYNGNLCVLTLVISVADAKTSEFYLERILQKETVKTLKPGEKVQVEVICASNNVNNENPYLDIFLAHPPELKSVRVQCAQIPLLQMSGVKNPITSPYGELCLESTSSSLIWGCVKLQETSVQKCIIRNTGKYTEKLSFSFSNNTTAFMFESEKGLSNTLKVSLIPATKFEIKVHFTPKVAAQFKESVLITRDPQDGYKKLIPLYAYGGKGNLLANNIAFDFERNCKKILISDSNLVSNFSLENNGDGTSFFLIEPPSVDIPFINITPKMGILSPGEKIKIAIKLIQMDKPMTNLVIDKNSEVKVSTITITQGDESTRLRLKRLYGKYKTSNSLFFKPFHAQLSKLVSIPSPSAVNESHFKLKDPLNSFIQLYKEGVKEWKIDVVAGKDILQSSRLNSTEFISLDASLMPDETIFQMDSIRLVD